MKLIFYNLKMTKKKKLQFWFYNPTIKSYFWNFKGARNLEDGKKKYRYS